MSMPCLRSAIPKITKKNQRKPALILLAFHVPLKTTTVAPIRERYSIRTEIINHVLVEI